MATLDRKQAPPFQLSTNYSLPLPDVFRVTDQVKLFAFRDLQLEVVKLELIFKSGKWFESTPGASHFTAQMLSKGTLTKNSYDIAQELDSLGAYLEISPGYDVVSVSLFSLRKNLLKALRILSEILLTPSFNDEELRLMKDIFQQNLKINNEKTSFIASREIRKSVFGETHPYGSSLDEEGVKKITRSDLQSFFGNGFPLDSVFLVGKLSEMEVDDVINLIPMARSVEPKHDLREWNNGQSHFIAKPNSVQSSIRLAKKCLQKKDHSDYFDAVMFNHILGGFFGSRLMKNIREEKGLTYGIYSSMSHFLHDSFWVIGAEVNQQHVVSALSEIHREIEKLQQDLVSAEELETARNYFIGSWQSENSTLFSVAEKFRSIHLWNLPENYYSHLLKHVEAITPEQIRSVANRYFNKQGLIEVRVG